MSKRARFITAILSVLFALTAIGAVTAYAENMDEGNDSPQDSYSEQQDDGPGQQGDDESQQDEYDDPQQGGSGSQYEDSSDDDEDYGSSSSRYNDYDEDDDDGYYYDSDGNEYNSPDDIYVGGDQTYTPPASTPSTTAALYDTTSTKIDNQTLTGNDWKDIQKKLTESSNSTKNSDSGDFAFIQKNTSTEDNGHWMLIVGFALILLSVIGFITLIARAGRNKKTVPAVRTTAAKSRYRYDDDYDDYSAEVEEEQTSKRSKNGRRYR